MLSAAAVLLHMAALGGVQWGWSAREPVLRPVQAMQVRVVDAPAAEGSAPATQAEAVTSDAPVMPGVPGVPVTAPSVAAAPIVPPALKPLRTVPRPLLVAAVAPMPVRPPRAVKPLDPATAPAASAEPAEPAPIAAAPPVLRLALNTAEAPAAVAGDEPIPHYRTRLPPATTLRYEMSRGVLTGTGELTWRPQGDRYELTLKGSVSGLDVLTQVSTGAFDAAGVAPVRFTDKRLRRGMVAANFQRALDKATFSGPSTEVALLAGAQDRLSWMVQLAAIVAADPQHRAPGAKVSMQVIGAHGEAGVWSFRCIGPEAVESRAGAIQAIKFVREPREPYDTTVQVWLDPLNHDLPVRATQKSGPSDEGFELRLREVVPPN